MEGSVTIPLERYHELLKKENVFDNNNVLVVENDWSGSSEVVHTNDEFIVKCLQDINECRDKNIMLNNKLSNASKEYDKVNNRANEYEKLNIDLKYQLNKLPWYKRIFKKGMKQVKPIFVIRLPYVTMQDLNVVKQNIEGTSISDDYHVLIFCINQDEVTFDIFNAKDVDEVKLQELKEIVRGEIN